MAVGQLCDLPGLAAVRAEAVGGRLAHRHGGLRPLLRHPDGRRHHGAERDGHGTEGGGRDDAAAERGPLPFAHSELLRRHHDPRLAGRVPLRLARHQGPPPVRARRARRAPLDRLRASRGPRHRPQAAQRERVPGRVGTGHLGIPHAAPRRDDARRRGRRVEPDRPRLGGRLRLEHPRRHRAQEVRGAPRLPRPARPADRAGQPPAHPRPGPADAGAGAALGRPGGGVVHRPRQLQGLQRLAGPRRRRQAAADGGRSAARHSALGRHRGPARRGRVRHSGRGRLVRPRARNDRRTGARGAQARLPPAGGRQHVDHRVGQHRHRRRGPPVGRGPPARRRHRAVPGQGRGSGPVGPLRALHAVGGQGAPQPQVGPRDGAPGR